MAGFDVICLGYIIVNVESFSTWRYLWKSTCFVILNYLYENIKGSKRGEDLMGCVGGKNRWLWWKQVERNAR